MKNIIALALMTPLVFVVILLFVVKYTEQGEDTKENYTRGCVIFSFFTTLALWGVALMVGLI